MLDLATRLVVLMHRFETRLSTNTGRLALLALTNSELMVRGDPARPIDPTAFAQRDGTALLLFPADEATVLDVDFVASVPRPITLIVPDGNWRQAQRAGRREPALAHVQRVKLAPGEGSTYRLRHGARADGLATLEAIARAMRVLEGPGVQAQLDALFVRVVERTLWSRGQLPLSSCSASIPPAAVAEARASGRHVRASSR